MWKKCDKKGNRFPNSLHIQKVRAITYHGPRFRYSILPYLVSNKKTMLLYIIKSYLFSSKESTISPSVFSNSFIACLIRNNISPLALLPCLTGARGSPFLHRKFSRKIKGQISLPLCIIFLLFLEVSVKKSRGCLAQPSLCKGRCRVATEGLFASSRSILAIR